MDTILFSIREREKLDISSLRRILIVSNSFSREGRKMKSRDELFYLEFSQSLETDILLDDIGIIQTRGFPRRDVEGIYIYIYISG